MQDIQRHLPGTYLTDGRTLLWVVERVTNDSVLVENCSTLEELEMGDGDLTAYTVVETDDDE